MLKFICFGGYIISKNDKQRHYINAKTLPMLYKINPKECLFINKHSNYEEATSCFVNGFVDCLTKLYPQSNGNYKLKINKRRIYHIYNNFRYFLSILFLKLSLKIKPFDGLLQEQYKIIYQKSY